MSGGQGLAPWPSPSDEDTDGEVAWGQAPCDGLAATSQGAVRLGRHCSRRPLFPWCAC